MKFLTHPVSLVSLALVVLGAAFGRIEVSILGLIGFVGATAWIAMKASQGGSGEISLDSISNENRVLIAPLRRLHNEMAQIIGRNKDNAAVKVIGEEAFSESRRILEQAVRVLSLRDELTNARKGKQDAQKELASAESSLNSAETDAEKEGLKAAVEARKREIAHYGEADRALDKIEIVLRQSEAALSELKARLAVASAKDVAIEESSARMAETVGRLKALSKSFDEAEALAQELKA